MHPSSSQAIRVLSPSFYALFSDGKSERIFWGKMGKKMDDEKCENFPSMQRVKKLCNYILQSEFNC